MSKDNNGGKMKAEKRERFIPENSTKYEVGQYTIYTYEKNGTALAVYYRGNKMTKNIGHYRYANVEQRAKKVEEDMNRYKEQEKRNAESKLAGMMRAQIFAATLQEGVILYYSWGYDQTNVDFFEVVGRKGKSTVLLRKIETDRGPEDGFMTANVMPKKGVYTGPAFEKRLKTDWDALRMDFGVAKLWDGTPMRISWYA